MKAQQVGVGLADTTIYGVFSCQAVLRADKFPFHN